MNLAEAAFPARLGTSFRWLIAASAANQLGNALLLAAGPLLLASLTHDPLLIALAPVLQRLPLMVAGLGVGAYVDRVDRQRLIVTADLVRAGVLVALAAAIQAGFASVPLVLTSVFALGVAETFADIANHTMLPSTVPMADLPIGNARMTATGLGGQLVGVPLGGLLFAVGTAVPFFANAVLFAAGAALISRMRIRHQDLSGQTGRSMRHDAAEGLRWLLGNPPVRTLALTIVLFNVTYGAAWGVLVVWAQRRLGMGAVDFGLLSAATAVGGAIAVGSFGALSARVSFTTIMRGALITETLVMLALATTTSRVLAYAAMVAFGVEAFLWGTTSSTVRQRLVPHHLLGRVGSVYLIGIFLGMIVGGPIGGALARWDVSAPYWFAFLGDAILLVLIWRPLAHIAAAPPAESTPPPADPAAAPPA